MCKTNLSVGVCKWTVVDAFSDSAHACSRVSKFAQLSAPAGCKANVETRFCDASMQRGQLSTSFWRRTLPAVVLLVLHSGLDTQLNNAQDAATCLRDRTGRSLCWPKRLRITAADPLSERFRQSSCRTDQRRSHVYQSITCPDHREIRLRLSTAMLNRR